MYRRPKGSHNTTLQTCSQPARGCRAAEEQPAPVWQPADHSICYHSQGAGNLCANFQRQPYRGSKSSPPSKSPSLAHKELHQHTQLCSTGTLLVLPRVEMELADMRAYSSLKGSHTTALTISAASFGEAVSIGIAGAESRTPSAALRASFSN